MIKDNDYTYSLFDFCNISRPNFTPRNKIPIEKAEQKKFQKNKSKPQVQVVQLSLFDELIQ